VVVEALFYYSVPYHCSAGPALFTSRISTHIAFTYGPVGGCQATPCRYFKQQSCRHKQKIKLLYSGGLRL
jgi:hypothetical protein